jgi:hypothetical protein
VLWMLLIYVVAGNGYNSQPSLSPSFHAATFQTKEDCETAARAVGTFASPHMDDITKFGIITVCAPVLPPPPPPAPAAAPPPKVTPSAVPDPLFPFYPPPKRATH